MMDLQTTHKTRYVLGIECSNPSAQSAHRGEVALGKIGSKGSIKFVDSLGLSAEARGSDGLVAAIDALTNEHGIEAGDIGLIAVSVGPGGYTALRVSVTVAKVLSLSIGCPVVPVPTAAVAAVGGGLDGVDAVIGLASKNGKAHCTRVVDGEMAVLGVIDADELVKSGAGVLVGDGHLPVEMVEAAKGAGMEVRGIELSGRACLEASAGFDAVDAGELGPLYAREPDAVTQWRQRHG